MTKKDMRILLKMMIMDTESLLEREKKLLEEMRNRPRIMRGKSTSQKITPEIITEVKRLHKVNPYIPQHEIAKKVGIKDGRVSEILAGKRT